MTTPWQLAGYVYRPRSEAQCQRQSEAARQRLGIPPGYRMVYGHHVPEGLADEIRAVAQRIASKQNYDKAAEYVAGCPGAVEASKLKKRWGTDYELVVELFREHMSFDDVLSFTGLKYQALKAKERFLKKEAGYAR